MARILLIGSSFFGYRDRVAAELRRQGHEVDTVDDRPSESVAFRSVAKVAPRALSGAVSRHADTLVSKMEGGGYSHVIYLGGMTFLFDRDQVGRMRSASHGAEFVAYLWDSVANSRALSRSLDLFDRVLSFDPEDCERHGMALRPLFYSKSYSGLPVEPEGGFLYDACFVGSVHQPSKFEAVRGICEDLEREGLRVFKHFYMPSRSSAALRRATSPAYRGARLAFDALPAERVAEVYARSRAVIDSPQAGQSGLTMRTLETVGARRKLVTANRGAASYDFARYGGVAVWRGPGSVGRDFFDSPYRELPKDVYESYSIGAFAASLLGEGDEYRGYGRRGR